MARRRQSPQVAKPGLRRRVIELGKDVLIVALTCSALLLAAQTPMASQLRELVTPAEKTAVLTALTEESVTPYGMAVRNSRGLYGVNYDQTAVGTAFRRFAPILGEALSTASAPEKLTQSQWRELLEAPGVCCVFQGAPTLSILSAWTGGESAPEGQAEMLALGWDGTKAYLAWRDGSDYLCAGTSVAYTGYLETALEEFSPNGAAFAYTLVRNDEAYDTLDPYVLVTMTARRPATYNAVSPDLVGDADALERLLGALGFRSGVGSAYEAAGDLAINESGDRLRVNSSGRVIFHTGGEGRYSVPMAGEKPTAQEAAAAAWEVLGMAAEPWRGEEKYVLTGAEQSGEGWTVTFHARLGGVPVLSGEDGWCAQFTIKNGEISDFVLHLRGYAATGGNGVVLSERLAAAALHSQPHKGGRLMLCYADAHAAELSASWVAEE